MDTLSLNWKNFPFCDIFTNQIDYVKIIIIEMSTFPSFNRVPLPVAYSVKLSYMADQMFLPKSFLDELFRSVVRSIRSSIGRALVIGFNKK